MFSLYMGYNPIKALDISPPKTIVKLYLPSGKPFTQLWKDPSLLMENTQQFLCLTLSGLVRDLTLLPVVTDSGNILCGTRPKRADLQRTKNMHCGLV